MSEPSTVVLVEGESDRIALLAVASRLGHDLPGAGVAVQVMGGITNTRAFALRYGPRGLGLRLLGLYDAPDEARLRRGLADAGVAVTGAFFACTRDLEDELVRAAGLDTVESVIEAQGELASLRLLAGMPAQRGWTRLQLVRRFLGNSGRKARYARLLVEATDAERLPGPLVALLERASRP